MKKIEIRSTFKNDYISREAGERLRNMILESSREKQPIELDFSGLIVASTSFFDESIAKLANEGWSPAQFHKIVHLSGINRMDLSVLKQVAKYRGLDLSDLRAD